MRAGRGPENQVEQQSRLKQRLVGAIVLVALAVIFIPMLLNGEREEEFIVNGSSIPAKPSEIENIRQLEFSAHGAEPEAEADSNHSPPGEIRIPVDERSAALLTDKGATDKGAKKPVAPVKQTDAESQNRKPKKRKPESADAATRSKGKNTAAVPATHAWAVQVGSFQQKSNALKLRDTLRKQKYKVFVEGVRSKGQLNYRVRLGPYISRAGAEQVRESLQAKQNIKGLVVRHP